MNIVRLEDFKKFSPEKMKKNNLFQTPRFFCDVYGLEPGQAQQGHVHGEQDKVFIVLDGQGTFQVGKQEQVLSAGRRRMSIAAYTVDRSLGSITTSPAPVCASIFSTACHDFPPAVVLLTPRSSFGPHKWPSAAA